MNHPYQQVPTSHGCRFELPQRELGDIRKVGIFIMAICGFGVLMLLVWSLIWLFIGIGMVADNGVMGLLVAAVSLIGFAGMFFALKFSVLGYCIWRDQTRCHIEVGSDYVVSNERFGPFNWRRKLPIQSINRLTIECDSSSEDSSSSSTFNWDPELMTIRADAGGKGLLIAPAYRYEILAPLIRDLGEELNRVRADGKPIEVSEQVSVAKERWVQSKSGAKGALKGLSTTAATGEDVYQKPADSNIEVYDYGGTDAYKVPPMGIWKGSKGLLGFSIFWNGFMFVFTTVLIVVATAGGLEGEMGWLGFSIFLLVSALFWLIGICTLIAAINAGRRSAMLGIAEDQLFVERKSIFGTKWLEWPVGEVHNITVGPSGTEINNVPVMELKIHVADGKQHGMLSQVSNDDLYWIAQELDRSIQGQENR